MRISIPKPTGPHKLFNSTSSTMLHPDKLAATSMYVLKCLAYSALAFHIWEWLSGFSFEVEHIWRKRHSLVVKWQYLWSRYIGIAAQIGNAMATGYCHSHYVVPRKFCMGWYLGQLLFSQSLLFSLEFSLIHRLYALTYSNNWVRLVLYALVIAENIIVIACGVMSFLKVEFVAACLPHKANILIAIISGAVGINQMILWGLTILYSRKVKMPLTSLVMRDGTFVFAVVSMVIIGGTVNAFVAKHNPVVNPFSAFVAATASLNCRIIINMEGMPQKERSTTSMIEFTSFIDTGFSNTGEIALDQLTPSSQAEEAAVRSHTTEEH